MNDMQDFTLPFRVEGQDANGRIVKLNHLASDVLSRHDYPEAVGRILGEALVLAAMLGSMLKFDGRFILQLQGKGPISMLVGDYASGGALRGFAQFDADALSAALSEGQTGIDLLGEKGHMAFTVDQGADMSRPQAGQWLRRHWGISPSLSKSRPACVLRRRLFYWPVASRNGVPAALYCSRARAKVAMMRPRTASCVR